MTASDRKNKGMKGRVARGNILGLDRAAEVLKQAQSDPQLRKGMTVRVYKSKDGVVMRFEKKGSDKRFVKAMGGARIEKPDVYYAVVKDLYEAGRVETQQAAATVRRSTSEREKNFYQHLASMKK
jgi:hypothetical protein